MDGYCVWVDTIKKIASFHHVEQSDFMHFLQHETFMAYLCTLALPDGLDEHPAGGGLVIRNDVQ